MPWSVRKGGGNCGDDQWAVVNTETGRTMGCHDTRDDANAQLAALNVNVQESAVDATPIAERVALTEAASGTPTTRRFKARLIEGDRWGVSGYYSRAVLERDGSVAWPEGTAVYLDHPTESEMYERPERSVRDLAGKIATTPAYESDGLYADVEVYPHVASVVEAMADDIGMSVRADADINEGEVDGRHGQIIERLVHTASNSVDFVTRAGAGGRLVSLLESARRSVEEAVSDTDWSSFSQSDYTPAQWRRACLIDTGQGEEDSKSRYKLPVREPSGSVNRNGVHAAAAVLAGGRGGVQASADQKRSAARKLVSLYRNQLNEDPPDSLLRAAGESTESVREAVAADIARALHDAVERAYPDSETSYAWMCDYDPDKGLVYFHWRQGRDVGIYQRPYAINDDGTASLSGDPVEVTASTVYTPVHAASESTRNVPTHSAGQHEPITEESEEDTTMPQIEEARLRQLEEDAGRVTTLESERDTARTERDDLREQLAVERARDYARDYGTRRVREANADLPQPVVERIVAEAMRQIPMTDGDEGQRRLDTDAFNTRVDEARAKEETYLAGISETTGRVRGLGGDSDKQVSESDVDNIIAGAFGRQVKGA